MYKTVFQEFEKICSARNISGRVLEIGATPDDSSLLNMKALGAAVEKVGLNIDGPHQYRDFSIVKGNANSMTCFEDNSFDAVLCNSVLEHDKYFWKTISEIKRVTKSGGFIIVGVPGYGSFPGEKVFFSVMKILACLFPGIKNSFLVNSSITLRPHHYPADYYRFSQEVFKDIFFDGMLNVDIRTVMNPPRIIGFGTKP